MALLQDLISQIKDPALRELILKETDKLLKQKKFGLVYEEHLPERTLLYDSPIKKGSTVALKTGEIKDVYTVLEIDGDTALCLQNETKEQKVFPIDDIVVVASFGEPIYPCLTELDAIENAPGDNLWHVLIESDNYHALQLLEYLYTGKVDCIYIDPPYNSGARDWKYNNDYVDGSDNYRHSKWLSMMEKRLKIAKKLLNPKNSVLIVTIDEKEYLHLGCLLEELFPEANMQMISTVINPSGVARDKDFYRTDEYIFILKIGNSSPTKLQLSNDWITAKSTGKDKLRWRPIRRQGSHDNRNDSTNQFYPIFIALDGKQYLGCGDSLDINISWKDIPLRNDCITVWPLKPDDSEGCWQISQNTLNELFEKGYVKVTHSNKWGYVPQYLARGEQVKVENGQFPVLGKDKYGTIITDDSVEEAPFIPGTQWRITTHNSREYGAKILNDLIGKRFSFPKSLYAVRDALRFFVANNPNALILDFFAGSGTTLHAVNLLNAQDGGKRRCIMVTNNEVSEAETKALKVAGHKPGDEEWDNLGIARYVTWPRTTCSIKGVNIKGEPLKGAYLDSDIQMADGFKANAVFFKLGFLDKTQVELGTQFKKLLSVFWLKAGGIGVCPELDSDILPDMLILPENKFAVLIEETKYGEFLKELSKTPEIETVFIVTDSADAYKNMAKGISGKTTYQLYRDYLDNFRINVRR